MSVKSEDKLMLVLSPKALFTEELKPGPAFPLVKALCGLKRVCGTAVEIMILSRDRWGTSTPFYRAVKKFDLDIVHAAFIEDVKMTAYLKLLGSDLYLSDNEEDVQDAINAGCCAALIHPCPAVKSKTPKEFSLAFDADAVIFDDEELISICSLEEFAEHERVNADVPMPDGPFARLYMKLCHIRELHSDSSLPIKLNVVTSRGAPSDARIINSFEARQAVPDGIFFMDGGDKLPKLKELAPLMYFDDMVRNVEAAAEFIPAARVPYKEK